MRIRTGGDYAHRMDAIEQAAQFYGQNMTASVINACEDIPRFARVVEQVLQREGLTTAQKREIAALFDLGESFSVTFSESIAVHDRE